ncbi:MAG: hypothetical protein R2684_16210 [Pyrinomonadaceae bacterium]
MGNGRISTHSGHALFRRALAGVLIFVSFSAVVLARATENVILVTLDGVRVEEVFGGMDVALYKEIDEKAESRAIFKRFYAETERERREKLMPFFWRELMTNHGSIAGNRKLGSEAKTTNNHLFSYPGYSEIMTGEAHDDVIKSNDRIQNKYPSFLQFLKGKMNLGYNDVASFASWNVFNEIVSSRAGEFEINAGYESYSSDDPAAIRLSREQFETPTPWDSVRHDYYTFNLALSHLKRYGPKVIHIGLGETDDWSHGGRYDLTLDALHRSDRYLAELWGFLESDKRYKGKTSLIVAVDHGRGTSAKTWSGHGSDIPEARNIWIAFVSPEMKQRGEWKNKKTIYQNQIAATLCAFLGYDLKEQNPNAGKPVGVKGFGF